MTILLVEDNEAITMGLEYLLTQEGYLCRTAKDVASAKMMLAKEEPSLALLDVSLPDGNGFALCGEMKKAGIPIIFLTAKEEERDVVKGFELGADDYIIKPFRNRELISRIKNVLGRYKKEENRLIVAHLRMDLDAGKAYADGQEISLTKLEYRILAILMRHPGRLFTREEILAEVWDSAGNFVNDNTLSVAVKRIREKISDKDGTVIKTVRGMGYRLDADT